MRIESFVASVGDFFRMTKNDVPSFGLNRVKYIIPKYQREYKWDGERVLTLLTDINKRDKFLGNVILNKVSSYYEIVDGQQRITTILLILLALYNKSMQSGSIELSEEQKAILDYLKRNGQFVLENESIGEYLKEKDNTISIQISDDKNIDIYYQKSTFEKLYSIIVAHLESIEDISSFQKKVLDCQVMVLLGETEGQQYDSIEEVFLDINFKSQLLDVADIFKGYCFKNYFSRNHEELKTQWAEIRKYTKSFERLGYHDTKETSEYLYHYLLSKPDSYDITANLSPRGRHYLEGKNNTETKALLQEMGSYGQHIIRFIDNLSVETYAFEDVCSDARRHLNEISVLRLLRQMSQKILSHAKAQYHKFPFMMFIHCFLSDDSLKDAITFEDLKKFITNYYVYAFLFINDSKAKNKGSIDRTIFSELYNKSKAKSETVKGILASIRDLRKSYLLEYKQFRTFTSENTYTLYSLIDNYVAANNFIAKIYCLPDYNKEHFLIHDNPDMNIDWFDKGNNFTFGLKDLLGKPDGTNYKGVTYKKQTSNYLILPEALNRNLRQYDIVRKIELIKQYYENANESLPTHVNTFINHIEEMYQFQDLRALKGSADSEDKIKKHYKAFITEYFSEERQRILYETITSALKDAFRNNLN